MEDIPKNLLCKAYLVNNMPDKITGDLLDHMRKNAELVKMAFKLDYADLVCRLVLDLPNDVINQIDIIGPTTVAEYEKRQGDRAFMWGLAVKCGMSFQVSVNVKEAPAVPHEFFPDGRINVSNHGYTICGDGWNFVVSLNRQNLAAVVSNCKTFPLDRYDKKFTAEVMLLRVKNGCEENVNVIYSVLGKYGIAEYIKKQGEDDETKDILDIIAKPDDTIAIGKFELRKDKFDVRTLNLLEEFKCDLDFVCQVMDYACSVSHLCDSEKTKTCISDRAKRMIKLMMTTKPEWFTMERYRSLAKAVNVFA
jgi:hypothetical protein